MALRNPLDVLGFGAPRQGGFGGPAVPMAPPMPGPGFAPVTGPGGAGNVLPARFGGGRLDRFQQNHPRASGFLADNSSALLHFGLGLLSGGGVPSRSWAGAQQGLAYGGQVDRERVATRKEEEDAAREAEEYAAVLDEIGLADDERRVLEMIGPEAGLPFVLERLSAQPEAPEFGPIITGEAAQALGLDPTKAYQQEANGEWHQVGGSGVSVSVPVTVGQGEVGTIPQSYELFTDPETGARRMRLIPGSPEAAAAKAEDISAANREGREDVLGNVVLENIDTALANAGAWTTGFLGARTRGIEGTPAYDLAATIDTIKANIGFQQLQQMREASPTGGALGQVAVQEIAYLQAALGNLDTAQSQEQFRENLERVKLIYLDIVHGAGNWRFGEDGEVVVGRGIALTPATPAADPADDTPPEGVPPELWEVMTPEERALWQ